jgi:VanZ family protein
MAVVNRNLLFVWAPLILYMCGMWYISSIPLDAPASDVPFSDKIYHIIEYALFGYLLARTVAFHTGSSAGALFAVVMVLGTLWGASDEAHQYFVPCRDANISDIMADAAGVLAGYLIFKRVRRVSWQRS